MRLAAAFLCDAASVRENLLHVLGAGINRLTRESLPAPMDVDLAIMLDMEFGDLEVEHELLVDCTLLDPPEGVDPLLFRFEATIDVSGSVQGPQPPRDERFTLSQVVPLRGIAVGQPGLYLVSFQLDGREGGDIRFRVDVPSTDESTS